MKCFAEDEIVQKTFVDAALSRSILPETANECEDDTVSGLDFELQSHFQLWLKKLNQSSCFLLTLKNTGVMFSEKLFQSLLIPLVRV